MDDERLRYIPYIGERWPKKDTALLQQELKAAYNPRVKPSGRKTERSHQVRAYLDAYLNTLELGLTQGKLVQYCLGLFNEASGQNLEGSRLLLTSTMHH